MATQPRVFVKRTSTPNSPPTGLAPGELAVEMADPTRLWVGVPPAIDASERKLLNSKVTVKETAPVSPAQGDLWYEADSGVLWLYYTDATSAQWVQVNGASATAGTFARTVNAALEEIKELRAEVAALKAGSH